MYMISNELLIYIMSSDGKNYKNFRHFPLVGAAFVVLSHTYVHTHTIMME